MLSAHGSCSPSPSAGPPSGLIRLLQGEFTKEQITYLKEMLPAYLAHQSTLSKTATGPRMVRNVKGEKGNWLKKNVYSNFVEKFSSDAPDEPNLASLKTVRTLMIKQPDSN